jgi:CRP/FNR family transcriptional regulator, cyclic AMP receptor protein
LKKLAGVHSWIGLLPESLRDEVLRSMHPKTFRDGQRIYAVGETGSESYLLVRGRVRVTNQAFDGKELLVMVLQPGDCFGDHSMVDRLPRVSTTTAIGKTDLLVLYQSDFERLYAEHGDIARSLLRVLCYRYRLVYSTALDAALLSLQQRVARQLVRLAYSFGKAGVDGATIIEAVSHEDLAQIVGATRQTVSKALKELQGTGALTLSYRRITIPDLERFAKDFGTLIDSGLAVPSYGHGSYAG